MYRLLRFFCKNQSSLTPLLFLFRKKSRLAHLFGPTRPHNGSLSLPTFCEFGGSYPTTEMPKISFSCGSHTPEQSPLCSGLFFCLRQKNKPSARSLAPPFPKKVMLRLRCSLVNALRSLRLAINLFRRHEGSNPTAENVKNSFSCASHTSPQAVYRLRRFFMKNRRRAHFAASPSPQKVMFPPPKPL